MKKISLYGAAIVALGIGFTACDQLHNDLRLEPPTSYTLDAPEKADQLMIFGMTGSNVDNVLNVVTYNPYNINTTVDFQLQVATSKEAFATWDKLVAEEIAGGNTDGNYDFVNEDGLPYVVTINNTYLTPSFSIPGADFCDAVNAVYGFTEEYEIEPVPVAIRAHSWIPGVDYSSIFSDVVELAQVQSYIPIREPRNLYLVGVPNGWSIDSSDLYLTENSPGSNIYKGTIAVGANQFTFRFYSELGNWNANAIGACAGYDDSEDIDVDIEFTDDKYSGAVYDGKGKWHVADWEGGTVEITIDLNTNNIDMIAHIGATAPVGPTGNALYLIGEPQGWNISSSDMFAEETSKGSKIYTGIFDIPAGKFMFRFYSQLGDWDKNSVGSQNEDSPVEINFTDGVYSGDVVAYNEAEGLLGKGAWSDPSWEGGTIRVEVNLNTNKIKMTNITNCKVIYVVGGCQGWDVSSDAMPLYETAPDTNIYTGTYDITTGNLQFKIYTELGNWDTNVFGSTADGADQNTDITVPYKGSMYPGKGNWYDAAFAGSLTFTVDLNTNEISLQPNE